MKAIFKPSFISRLAIACAVSMAFATPGLAQFPDKPIRLVVGFSAGGGTDFLARLVAKGAAAAFGQPVVVENIPGGGGGVAATRLMSAEPDGHTIGMAVTSTFSYLPLASKAIRFGIDDFDYVTSIAAIQNAFVAKADAPFDSIEDIVRLSKSGEKLSFAAQSPAVTLMMGHFARNTGIDMKIIPVKGGAVGMKEVLGGHIDMAWSAGIHPKFGNDLKVIASASAKRLAASPDVPTLREQGVDLSADSYFLMFAPKGIPQDRLQRLIEVFSAAADTDEVRALAMESMSLPIEIVTGEELRKHVRDDAENYQRLIQATAASDSAAAR